METKPGQGQSTRTAPPPSFWMVLALLAAISLLHYLTPQVRLLPSPMGAFLRRHAVERILYVFPVAAAASTFGVRGGIAVLAAAVGLMLPRAIWVSPQPADALVEIGAVAIVGYLVTWLIELQARESALRQQALARLEAINALNALVTESLDLDRILGAALAQVLEVMDMETGLIFSVDQESQELVLGAHQGVSEALVRELARQQVTAGFYGKVAQSGERMIVEDAFQTTAMMEREGLRTQVILPLQAKGETLGVLAVATRHVRRLPQSELELLTALGGEIGPAMNNARLYESMRFYARRITQVQESERQRIARELHDETIQVLIAMSRRLEALATLREPLSEEARERLASLRELARNAVSGARRFIQDLRPLALDHLGLVPALKGLTESLSKETDIEARLCVTGQLRRLLPEQELALFRIAQEALNNVRRHAQASEATVRLDFGPQEVQMIVQDNGCGFKAPRVVGEQASAGRLGLVGMAERARTWGGSLTIQSQEGQGTEVTARMAAQPYAPNGRPGSARQVGTGGDWPS